MNKLWLVMVLLGFGQFLPAAQSLKQFRDKPKLVVLIVLDQFRSDYLTRFEESFLPAEKNGQLGGFKYLMTKGAYFPYGHYNIFQAMTCPGHGIIMTGAYPSETGISMNEWYDRESGEMVYCVKDKEFGVSPRRLKTTTVSDELKNIDKKSMVVSVAIKDRAAIMMGGLRPDQVVWLDEEKMQWVTSGYYGKLPEWAGDLNGNLNALKGKSYVWKGMNRAIPFADSKVYSSPFGIEISIDLALAALEKEKLGQHPNQTDFLLLSLSSHDFAGHTFGANSPEMADMTIFEDQQISRFFNALEKKVGMRSSLVMLTGDHGIPPSTEYTKSKNIKADRLDYLVLFKKIYAQLDEKYGAPKNGPWIVAFKYFNFYLNPKVLSEKKLDSATLSQEIKKILLREEGVSVVYTRDELLQSRVAPGFWSEALVNQFVFGTNGDVIFMPDPFYYESAKWGVVTHMTGYNYDTRVPLIFAGAAFKPGVYAEYARVTDLAPTLSFVLNVVAPPKARGRVLHEALQGQK